MLIEFIKPDFDFTDDRGSLTQLVHKGWNQVNYITSVGGAFRGNHYHCSIVLLCHQMDKNDQSMGYRKRSDCAFACLDCSNFI